MNEEIELRPGIIDKNSDGLTERCRPILTRIASIKAEDNWLDVAIPGGLIGVGTTIDPCMSIHNLLVGNIIGHPGELPSIFIQIQIQFFLLRRLLGIKKAANKEESCTEKMETIGKLKSHETLMLNIGSTSVCCEVTKVKEDFNKASLTLVKPVCTELDEKIAISRKIQNNFRLIGWGKIIKGFEPN